MILDGKIALKLVSEFELSYPFGDGAIVRKFFEGRSNKFLSDYAFLVGDNEDTLCTKLEHADLDAILPMIQESVDQHLNVIIEKLKVEWEKEYRLKNWKISSK